MQWLQIQDHIKYGKSNEKKYLIESTFKFFKLISSFSFFHTLKFWTYYQLYIKEGKSIYQKKYLIESTSDDSQTNHCNLAFSIHMNSLQKLIQVKE